MLTSQRLENGWPLRSPWSIPGFKCLHFVAMSKRLGTDRNGSVVVAKTPVGVTFYLALGRFGFLLHRT